MFKLSCVAALLLLACDGDAERVDASADARAAPPDARSMTPCERDADCDDGAFCNGVERCDPGSTSERGCRLGEPPCGSGQFCSESRDQCLAAGCEPPGDDADRDMDPRVECGGTDCDDSNSLVSGMATERCDAEGVDEDCNPETIYRDAVGANDGDLDGDGHIDDRCFNLLPGGGENRGDDCDDTSESVHATAVESCNLVDDDCDGSIDEGLAEIRCLPDMDGDGIPVSGDEVRACTCPSGFAPASSEVDCEDTEPNAYPGQTAFFTTAYGRCSALCTNTYDYDCDGVWEPEPEIRCDLDRMLRCSSVRPMPRDSHTASDCGRLVEFVSCNEDCSLRSEGMRPLGCR